MYYIFFFFFSSRRRHTRYIGDWSSDVCSSDLGELARVSGRTSPFGAVLDAVCDRYGDLAVLAGAAIGAGTTAAWPWAFAALVANWQLSFLRREHERIAGSLPPSHVRWQWSRDVRLLVLALSCVLLHPLWGLVAAAVVGNLDALRRVVALIAA